MKLLKALVLALALMGAAAPASASYIITYDQGGVIDEYIEKYTMLRQTGAKVVIDGPCISACTLVTGLIEPDKVCITDRASLGFHSASLRTPFKSEYSKSATQMMWSIFPDHVRYWVVASGWDGLSEHPDVLFLDRHILKTFYKECS
jgi:hypothetical protein